jgi:predicted kinase
VTLPASSTPCRHAGGQHLIHPRVRKSDCRTSHWLKGPGIVRCLLLRSIASVCAGDVRRSKRELQRVASGPCDASGMDVKVIVISGSMGSGKTTVMMEASDLLAAANVIHAAIDLDGLGIGHVPEGAWPDLAYRNLASVWENYAAAGATRLLLAEAVESHSELDRIRKVIPNCEVVVCRLRANLETMQRRVLAREPGMLQNTFVARVAELEALLDAAHVEDFSLGNDDRSITDVAREVLIRAGWL